MKWKDKNVLITGVSGFVGSYLVEKLVGEGANVYGLTRDNLNKKLPSNLTKKNIEFDDITLLNGNLKDITSLANAITKSEPDYIFHMAAQSFVPPSFKNPTNTIQLNTMGTNNLLESMRIKDSNARMIFAGSGEEYGLVISSKSQYKRALKRYKTLHPDIPKDFKTELPVSENNPLRPMNPYAASKVCADYLTQNYYYSFNLDTVVSRSFNHEGAGRGTMFVTSVVTSQAIQLKMGLIDSINIGNVNAFRDWTHINDIINGYLLLASKAKSGEVYNQGSMRTNSILSFILVSLEEAGYTVKSIETFNGDKKITEPTVINKDKFFDIAFPKTKIDSMMLNNEVEYTIKDKGIIVKTDSDDVKIVFNPERFRPSEVPILLSDTSKIKQIGAKTEHSITDIIKDQLEYFKMQENNQKIAKG